MPPQTTRFPLREQDSDISSRPGLDMPLSPSIRAGSIHGAAIQTPVCPSPSTRFNFLPSRSSVLERAVQVEGLPQGHRSAAQGSLLSGTPRRSRQTMPSASSNDTGESTTFNFDDVPSAQIIKERLFAKFGIPPHYQSLYSIHQWQDDGEPGLLSPGPPLSDENIVTVCQSFHDSAWPVVFLVRHSQPTILGDQVGAHTQSPTPEPSTLRHAGSEDVASSVSVDNNPSEPGSGYSGGPESKSHHPSFYTFSHVRKGSTSSINFPIMPRPPTGSPPQASRIITPLPHPAPPSTIATSSTDGSMAVGSAERERNNTSGGKGPPLSLRTGTLLSFSRTNGGNLPPPPPPPTYSPPPPPTSSYYRSSADLRRPLESSSTDRLLPQENVAERLFSRALRRSAQDRNSTRPGTSTGVHNPQAAASYARLGPNTGRNPLLVTNRPLSPILRSLSTNGRPHDRWAGGSLASMVRNGGLGGVEKQDGHKHTGLRLSTEFSRRNSSRGSAVNSPVNGQRSPLNGGTSGVLTSHVTRRREGVARLRSWVPRDDDLS